MNGPGSPNRRTLLRRGLLMIAGALGLVAAERRSPGQAVAAPSRPEAALTPGPTSLRFYGRGWRPQAQASLLGRRSDGDHLVGYGDLLDAPDGVVVGRFCTNGFCPETPFGHAIAAAPTIEFQTLALKDGTVFGMGAGALNVGGERTYAILGGTERYAGARGTYTARTTSAEPTGRSAVDFILTLTA